MDPVIAFLAALPGQLLAMLNAAMEHPIVWAFLALIPVAAFVLGGMQVHLNRTERRTRRRDNTRYGNQEKR